MRVRLDYGDDGLEVELPHEHVTVIEPVFRRAVADPVAALAAAIRSPLGRPPLREVVRRGQTVAISVCDITRAQPRQEMLAALFAEMPDIPAEDITILIATGTHRTNTPAELEAMLGADIVRRFRVINHDSRDAVADVSGQTTTGAGDMNRVEDADIRSHRLLRPHSLPFQRRSEMVGGPPRRSRDGAGAARRRAIASQRDVGYPRHPDPRRRPGNRPLSGRFLGRLRDPRSEDHRVFAGDLSWSTGAAAPAAMRGDGGGRAPFESCSRPLPDFRSIRTLSGGEWMSRQPGRQIGRDDLSRRMPATVSRRTDRTRFPRLAAVPRSCSHYRPRVARPDQWQVQFRQFSEIGGW